MQHRWRPFQCGRWLVILFAALVVSCQLVGGPPPEDEWLHATSDATRVVLYWNPPIEGTAEPSGYNLYRRSSTEAEYPPTPLNGPQPIARVSNCSELTAVVPEGSPEWVQLMDAFESCSAIFDPAYKTYNPAAFDAWALVNFRLRLARGWAYEDRGVTARQEYVYQLRGLQPDGTEAILGPEVRVVAGVLTPLGVPENLIVKPGDHKALCLWDDEPTAYDYVVSRAPGPGGGYQMVGTVSAFATINRDLQGAAISPQPGFVDYQRWDEEGEPIDHFVEGSAVSGPQNGVTYSYRVASRDILGQQGGWSSAQSATPMDHTSPRAPAEVSVDPTTDPASPGLVVSWRKVTEDIEGHVELDPTQTYEVYRADALEGLEDIAALPTHLVGSVGADPRDERTVVLSLTDRDPAIVPDFGETDFWYRVRCVDAQGNESAPSAAVAGRVPDTRPPGPTAMSGSEGHPDWIRVFWSPNPEPDLAGYQIYRGVCDRGEPYPVLQERACDFVLVGQVLLGEAGKRLAEGGSIYFDDPSVPTDSPICYAYWVRAFDMARNLCPGGAGQGCPAAGEYVCQRLLEATPPPAPIISALKARSNSVHIEWVSSPIQDLRAFHVYRSEEEAGEPEFVACVFLDRSVSREKWLGLRPSCADIPAEPYPTSVFGAYDDEGVEPNREYWYRVAAVDWLGNESEREEIEKIPAISTFTYSRDLPEAPTILSPTGGSVTECGLLVRWTPPFDSRDLAGFVVFRSSSSSGPYRQVSGVIAGNEFLDESAIRGRSYWYCVQAMGLDGKLSPPSEAVEHRY